MKNKKTPKKDSILPLTNEEILKGLPSLEETKNLDEFFSSSKNDDDEEEGAKIPFIYDKKIIKTSEKLSKSMMEYVDPESISPELSQKIDTITNQKDFVKNNKITKYQLKKLLNSMNMLLDGYYKTSVALCTPNCIIQERCPLAILGQAPYQIAPEEKHECPVETEIINTKVDQYVSAYAEKQNVDEENVRKDIYIMEIIGEIAESYILENRINTELAENGFLVDAVAGLNNMGDIATNKVVHPLYFVKQQIKKNRDQKYKMLLLTPEMELKTKRKNHDPSSKNAEIMKKAKEIYESLINRK